MALKQGAAEYRDRVEIRPTASFDGRADTDVAIAFGVKGHTKRIVDAYLAAGKHAILIDKALVRVAGAAHRYFRVCIDAPSPNRYMMRKSRDGRRWEELKVDLQPRRQRKRSEIVLALSSQKYCDYHGLGNATDYAQQIVNECRGKSKRPIVYRPKPSWLGYEPIRKTKLSRPPETMMDLLETAHVVVTHGSSAAMDAVISGVPAIALGESAVAPVAGSSLKQINEPPFPSDDARWQWAANVAWCQWTVSEFASGEAWDFIRREMLA